MLLDTSPGFFLVGVILTRGLRSENFWMVSSWYQTFYGTWEPSSSQSSQFLGAGYTSHTSIICIILAEDAKESGIRRLEYVTKAFFILCWGSGAAGSWNYFWSWNGIHEAMRVWLRGSSVSALFFGLHIDVLYVISSIQSKCGFSNIALNFFVEKN